MKDSTVENQKQTSKEEIYIVFIMMRAKSLSSLLLCIPQPTLKANAMHCVERQSDLFCFSYDLP